MAKAVNKVRILAIIALLAVAGGLYAFLHRNEISTDDAAIEATVVTVSPRVGGYVKSLYINDNQIVKAGDVLLEIDPADYLIKLERAQASLDAARANLSAAGQNLESAKIQAPSSADAAQAQVNVAQAEWENARQTLKRLQSLSDQARSRQQLDDAVAAQKKALSALNDAKARLRSAQTAPQTVAAAASTADQLAAVVRQAGADVAQAKKDLADTKIVAPIAGRIGNRGVEQGDYVQPGQQTMSLIAGDVWVVANFKETQLKKMRSGQAADIGVDAYPDLKLHGKVDSIQSGTGSRFSAFPPQNATGNFVKIVQRVPVKIVLDRSNLPPDVTLGPGMSVVPTVHVVP